MDNRIKELQNLSETYVEIADQCHREGNIEGAVDMYLNALYVQVQLFSVSSWKYAKEIAETYTRLGYLRLTQERYDLCQEDFQSAKTYRLLQKEFDKESFDESCLASCYRNLTVLYYRWEKYPKMREMAEIALPMYERLAQEDPDEYNEDVFYLRLLLGLR